MENQRQQLDHHGFAVLPGLISPAQIDELRTHVETLFTNEGDQAGAEFKQEPGSRRLANLVAKGRVYWSLLTHVHVLLLVRHVLHDSVKLSSLNVRSVNPGWNHPQPLHCDMGALPDDIGNWVCNVVWMLDDFTLENGPLRVVPGSHRWRQMPQDVLEDPARDHAQQVTVTGAAGSAIVLNAHLWHGGMANHTPKSRTAIHAFYCRRDKPQQQYQKGLLSPELQQELPGDLRKLLAIDDPENDRLTAADSQRSGFLK